jgi:hypothetical protein
MKCFGSLCILIVLAQCVYSQGWHVIVPLHSTRTDVERLLGPSIGECKCWYKFEGEMVRVDYGEARCKGYLSGWNVAAGTVLRLKVNWKQGKKFSDLHIDERKYEKAGDDTFTTYYSNREEGIQYTVSWQGMVEGALYVPAANEAHRRCPCFPPEDASFERSTMWDEFGVQKLDDALARLDNYAIQLQNIPRWIGYVIVYAGRHTSSATAKRYSRRFRSHLVTKRGLPASRVVMINGGYREDLEVELFLISKDISPPRASRFCAL